jgi:hypothetical protein
MVGRIAYAVLDFGKKLCGGKVGDLIEGDHSTAFVRHGDL